MVNGKLVMENRQFGFDQKEVYAKAAEVAKRLWERTDRLPADGTSGIFDFSPYIGYPCYEPLRERAFFEKVKAAHGTLSWPGEIDIAPEAVWADAVRTM